MGRHGKKYSLFLRNKIYYCRFKKHDGKYGTAKSTGEYTKEKAIMWAENQLFNTNDNTLETSIKSNYQNIKNILNTCIEKIKKDNVNTEDYILNAMVFSFELGLNFANKNKSLEILTKCLNDISNMSKYEFDKIEKERGYESNFKIIADADSIL